MSVKIDQAWTDILASEIFLNQSGTERIADVGDVVILNRNIHYPVQALRWVNHVAVTKHQAVIHNSSDSPLR
jgi:hypothetical protein